MNWKALATLSLEELIDWAKPRALILIQVRSPNHAVKGEGFAS